jgi:hypothetical protein
MLPYSGNDSSYIRFSPSISRQFFLRDVARRRDDATLPNDVYVIRCDAVLRKRHEALKVDGFSFSDLLVWRHVIDFREFLRRNDATTAAQ